ncbi:CPK2, partial [Symbiodinium microadriaticum]
MSTCLQLAAMFFMLPPLGASESADLLWGHISRSHSLCQGTLGRVKVGFRQGRFEVFRARKPYVGRLVHQRARRPELAESSLITGFDMIRLALHGGKVASGQHFRALETLAAPGKGGSGLLGWSCAETVASLRFGGDADARKPQGAGELRNVMFCTLRPGAAPRECRASEETENATAVCLSEHHDQPQDLTLPTLYLQDSARVPGRHCWHSLRNPRHVASLGVDIFISSGYRGCFGTVAKATDKLSGVRRAFKTVSKVKQAQMSKKEAATMALLDHPSICRLYDTIDDKDNAYFVMELCAGGDLQQRLEGFTDQFLPEPTAASLMKQLFSAMNYLHQLWIAHGDFAARNVLIKENKPLDQRYPLRLNSNYAGCGCKVTWRRLMRGLVCDISRVLGKSTIAS